MKGSFLRTQPKIQPWCDARGRYSAEHWILSHPNAMPCDLLEDRSFFWGYPRLPFDANFKLDLKSAPRYALSAYASGRDFNNLRLNCQFSAIKYISIESNETEIIDYQMGGYKIMDIRLRGFKSLYDELPSSNWYGWRLYNSHFFANEDVIKNVKIERESGKPLKETLEAQDSKKISVFYNLYTREESDVPRVKDIVNEQISTLTSIHTVFVCSIGVPFDIASNTTQANITLLQHGTMVSAVCCLPYFLKLIKMFQTRITVISDVFLPF